MFQRCITSKRWNFSVNHFNFSSCKLCIAPCYSNCLSKEEFCSYLWVPFEQLLLKLNIPWPPPTPDFAEFVLRPWSSLSPSALPSQALAIPFRCSAKKRWISTSIKFFFQWEHDVDPPQPPGPSQGCAGTWDFSLLVQNIVLVVIAFYGVLIVPLIAFLKVSLCQIWFSSIKNWVIFPWES